MGWLALSDGIVWVLFESWRLSVESIQSRNLNHASFFALTVVFFFIFGNAIFRHLHYFLRTEATKTIRHGYSIRKV